MEKVKNNDRKFQVGTFEITDSRGAMSFTGYVKVGYTVSPLFLVNYGSFNGNEFCSISFSSIELRTLASVLKSLEFEHNKRYKKFSGGKQKSKEFNVSVIENYTRFEFIERGNSYKINILTENLVGLANEIIFLVEQTVKNTYLTQSVREKKKRNKGNNNV